MTSHNIFTRDFKLCFLAQLVFSAGYAILLPALPIYLSRSGSTEVEIGVLIGALNVSSLILKPLIGRALFRISEKKFMAWGAILYALTSLGYVFLPPFWPLFILRIFQGIGFAFFFTTAVVFVANITHESYRGRSIGYFFLSFSISMALAPPLGIFLVNHFSFTVLFLVCMALSLCTLLFSSKLTRDEVPPVVGLSAADHSFFNPRAFPPGFITFLAMMIWSALSTFFPLYAITHGVSNPGLFFTAYAIVLISARTLGGRVFDVAGKGKIILPCLMAPVLSMTVLAFSKTLPMFILVAVVSAMGHAFLIPSLYACALDLAGISRGSAMAFLTAMDDLGMMLGPILMGTILHWTNFTAMFFCLAFIGVINFVYFLFFVNRKRNRVKSSPHCPPS